MTSRRIAQLIVSTTVAALGLVACSSGSDEASTDGTDRQAGLIPLATEVCVSREANAGPMTVAFNNSVKPAGNGPFNLDYVQCGQVKTSASPEVLRLNISDASGTEVIYIGAANPEIGYPKMTVKSIVDGASDTHSFSDGENYTYNVGPYSVEVERQADTDTAKSFRVWVSRP